MAKHAEAQRGRRPRATQFLDGQPPPSRGVGIARWASVGRSNMYTAVTTRPLTDSRYTIGLATTEDDADLRQLLRETPMPGPIKVSLEREPEFFAVARQEGGRHDTVVIRD